MSCEYSVLIVGACVVIIPAADGATQYKDLVDSVLLAQLIANKKIEKAPDIDWYNAYVEFLDDYWLRHSRARQEWPVAQDSVECVGDWVIASLFKDAVNKRGAAAATLQRLTRLSGTEPAIELLRGHMQRISTGEPGDVLSPAMAVRLLVVVAYTPTSVTSVYMDLKTDQGLDSNPLAQRYQAKDVRGNVCMRYADANLSETLYGPVRDAIALKVKDRLEDNVAMLTLTDEGSDKGFCAAD
ncbi:hypothetical protein [Pseudomonas fluorescens]|uniref:Uncharacterized protein n=1 Tax=Pseudomonas fluorescens TaxID=294 RepID=A0A0F4V923_PSEFL|nr:hypothetical protein [Pseudomonas fluorescens]KJZ64985.1 hypothetical protein VD17_15300 [Pseudomonas fluorescens]